MKTILLDCDGVVLDLASTVHRTCERLLSRKLPPPETWKSYDFKDAMQINKSQWEFCHQRFERQNKLGHLISYYPQAQSFVEHLGFDNKVVFTTLPWRGLEHWVDARLSLLDHFLGRRNFSYAFTDNKDTIAGDWLIDDMWENMANKPERGILFSRPWNIVHEHWAIHLARNYADVVEIIEKPVEIEIAVPTVSEPSAKEHAVEHVQKKSARKASAPKRKR